jgi:hypothetical protein
MVRAENIDSRISNFQLDNRSGRDHHSLAHLSNHRHKHSVEAPLARRLLAWLRQELSTAGSALNRRLTQTHKHFASINVTAAEARDRVAIRRAPHIPSAEEVLLRADLFLGGEGSGPWQTLRIGSGFGRLRPPTGDKAFDDWIAPKRASAIGCFL